VVFGDLTDCSPCAGVVLGLCQAHVPARAPEAWGMSLNIYVTGLAPGFFSTLMPKQGKCSQQTTPIAKGMRSCTLLQDARVDKWLSSIIKECDGMGVYIIHMKNLDKTGRHQTLYVYPPPSLHHTTTDHRPPPHQQMWLLVYGNATSLAALLGLLLGMDGVRKPMRPVQCWGDYLGSL
jgi:hypothetical protein